MDFFSRPTKWQDAIRTNVRVIEKKNLSTPLCEVNLTLNLQYLTNQITGCNQNYWKWTRLNDQKQKASFHALWTLPGFPTRCTWFNFQPKLSRMFKEFKEQRVATEPKTHNDTIIRLWASPPDRILLAKVWPEACPGTRAHNLWNFGCRAITINGIW